MTTLHPFNSNQLRRNIPQDASPAYRILFPSNTVQKNGTESILVGLFSMFKAAALPVEENKSSNPLWQIACIQSHQLFSCCLSVTRCLYRLLHYIYLSLPNQTMVSGLVVKCYHGNVPSASGRSGPSDPRGFGGGRTWHRQHHRCLVRWSSWTGNRRFILSILSCHQIRDSMSFWTTHNTKKKLVSNRIWPGLYLINDYSLPGIRLHLASHQEVRIWDDTCKPYSFSSASLCQI